jgi:hypothetical protein
MKFALKIAALLAALGTFPAIANAEEPFIRIGNNCYVSIGMVGGYPILLQIVCPNNVSENP